MKSTFFLVIVFLILSLCTVSGGYEVDVGIDGNSAEDPAHISQAVIIQNLLSKEITVFYDERSSQSRVFMFTIAPSRSVNMNTFVGHHFVVSSGTETNIGGDIEELTIKAGQTIYRIGSTGDNISKQKKVSLEGDKIKTSDDLASSILPEGSDGVKRTLNVGRRTRPHPLIKGMGGAENSGVMMNAKFRSLSPRTIDLWYDDGRGGTPQGTLKTGMESTTNTFIGHVFFATVQGDKTKEIGRFSMQEGKVLYVIHDDKDHPAPAELLERTEKEEKFMEDYFQREGIRWRHYYGPNGPRGPPVLYQWPASQIGQVHEVTTPRGYWFCKGVVSVCQRQEPVKLELEVVSLQPRVFVIPNFLSDFEAQEIIDIASPKIHHSTVGNVDAGGARSSSTRTSRNAWVSRESNLITETLFLRAADVLNIDEKLLRNAKNVEDMQVVNYQLHQKYDSHHDWGVSGYAESRFITMLLYLTDMPNDDAGGETAFPKADGGNGIKVQPRKGTAILFYNLLEDGNGDDLALHAALPVHYGEKWLANFWVWDPKRK